MDTSLGRWEVPEPHVFLSQRHGRGEGEGAPRHPTVLVREAHILYPSHHYHQVPDDLVYGSIRGHRLCLWPKASAHCNPSLHRTSAP